MRKYLLLIVLGIGLVGHAQICDDVQNNTTDPSNPKHYNGNDPLLNPYINLKTDGSGDPKLDWMENIYNWWHQCTSTRFLLFGSKPTAKPN